MSLDKEIQYVKGVGENRAQILNKLRIYTLEDLITYYPRDYEDRGKIKKLIEAEDGEEVLIKASVVTSMQVIRTKSKMTICKIIVKDDTDACEITWYNQPYLKSQFKVGTEYCFFGKITKGIGHIKMTSPVFDKEGFKNNTRKNYSNLSFNLWNITKSNKKNYRKWIKSCKRQIRRKSATIYFRRI